VKFFEFDAGFGCLAESEEQARELVREQVEAGNFIEGYDAAAEPIRRVYEEPSFILFTC